MTLSKQKKAFYALLSAGLVFILIGTISAVYNSVPVEVSIGNALQPGKVDILTPNMNVGNTANITIAGSTFNVTITDPNGKIIESGHDITNFHYVLVAQKDGQHTITVRNTGDSPLYIEGSADTKGNPIAFGGQMMLIVTGIIVTGLSLRLRNR
jgi:hypothetical protein